MWIWKQQCEFSDILGDGEGKKNVTDEPQTPDGRERGGREEEERRRYKDKD